MTNPYQTQYYTWLQNRRRQAIYNFCLSYHNINFIRDQILNGTDPRNDPVISAEYYALINEYGTALFESEMNQMGFTIIAEQDESPITMH